MLPILFNPVWDSDAKVVNDFTDVRELQLRVKAAGITLATDADETPTGPASLVAEDPDDNPPLVDQARMTE